MNNSYRGAKLVRDAVSCLHKTQIAPISHQEHD